MTEDAIEGSWVGVMTYRSVDQPFMLRVDQEKKPPARIDIPAVGRLDVPITDFEYNDPEVTFNLPFGRGSYVHHKSRHQ